MNAFGATPPDNVRKIFPLLRSYGEAAAKAPGPVNENGEIGPTPSTAEGHKKMLKMKVGPQSLLKTKGQKKWSSEFVENKQLSLLSR
jgi:hypothetical protein